MWTNASSSSPMAATGNGKPVELECLLKSDPIKNDLILQRIFWFCDVSSLKNVRLVSKKWRDLSLHSWRDKASIQLCHDSYESESKLEFRQFLDLINPDSNPTGDDSLQLRSRPFRRYSVEFYEWCSRGDAYWAQKHVAVTIFNSRAHHVKIHWAYWSFNGFDEFLSGINSDSLKTLEVSWSTLDESIPETVKPLSFSNLKRLKLHTRYLLSTNSPACSLWGYLLKSFPTLEALSVEYHSEYRDNEEHFTYAYCLEDRIGIANLLKSIRQSGGESAMPLKELEMIQVYTNQNVYECEPKEGDIIETLAECRFPLERLAIHVGRDGSCEGDKIPILPLLRSCRNTLQYLRASINFSCIFFSRSYETSKGSDRVKSELSPSRSVKIFMEALQEVRLLDGLEWALFLLAHLELPKLSNLIVQYEKNRNPYHGDRYGLISVSFPDDTVYELLETFELHDNPNIPPPKIILIFGKMMPNLVHLTIPLDKTTFPLICQNFKGLKTLHVLGAQSDYVELDDEGLTGLSKVQVQEEEGVPEPRRPNITDLEHLSDLSICCQRQLRRDDVKFTEHSVMYGFLQLPKLYYLSVAIKELSDNVKQSLLDHVKGNVDFQVKVEPSGDSFAVDIISEEHCGDARDYEDDSDSE